MIMIINWNRYKRKRPWPELKYYPGFCLEGLRKTTKISARIALSGPRFEPGTSRRQSRNANHSTTTLGVFVF
jgi:hypothetical protein